MQSSNDKIQNSYDPRWFIWTIVVLVATGITLVTYIITSDSSNAVSGDVTTQTIVHKTK